MVSGIVLAGGKKNELFQGAAGAGSEALLTIGPRYMIEYVIEALQKSEQIDRIIIAGPVALLEPIFPPHGKIILVESGITPVSSFMKALDLIDPGEERVLVATADIPLLTREAVDDFLTTCSSLAGDLFYPIVSKNENETKYPGVKRTYVHLKEGTFTGGNLILINPAVARKCIPIAEDLVSLRKKPLSLASYIGWKLLIRYMLGWLSLGEAELEVSKLLGMRGVGIISTYPEIGIDVDKESDYSLVKKVLAPEEDVS